MKEDWVNWNKMKEDWVNWNEEPREIEAEKTFKERAESASSDKPGELIKSIFGVDCIVTKPETKSEISGAIEQELIPLPRFAKLFKDHILKKYPWDVFISFSENMGYNLEETLQTIKKKFPEL